MFKDIEVKIIQKINEFNSGKILVKDLGDLGADSEKIVKILRKLEKMDLIVLINFNNTEPLIKGLSVKGEEYVDFFDEVDDAIKIGEDIINHIKKETQDNRLIVDINGKFTGWKARVENLIISSFGKSSSYYKNFRSSVCMSNILNIESGIEILKSLKSNIDMEKSNEEIKHEPVSVVIGDQIIGSPGAKAKNTGNMANGSQNVKQTQGDENYWIKIIIEVVVGLLVVYLAYKFGWNK